MTQRDNYYEGYVLKVDGNVVDLSLRQGQSPPFTLETIARNKEQRKKFERNLGMDVKIVLDSNYDFVRIE